MDAEVKSEEPKQPVTSVMDNMVKETTDDVDMDEIFDVKAYLAESGAIAAPEKAFFQGCYPENKFTKGQLLLIPDKQANDLPVVGRVTNVHKCWIFVHTEGLDQSHTQWLMVDDRKIHAIRMENGERKSLIYPPTGVKPSFMSQIDKMLVLEMDNLAPPENFSPLSTAFEPAENLFVEGMKLLIRDVKRFDGRLNIATVIGVEQAKDAIRVLVDGYPERGKLGFKFNSRDIFPLEYAEKSGIQVIPPPVPSVNIKKKEDMLKRIMCPDVSSRFSPPPPKIRKRRSGGQNYVALREEVTGVKDKVESLLKEAVKMSEKEDDEDYEYDDDSSCFSYVSNLSTRKKAKDPRTISLEENEDDFSSRPRPLLLSTTANGRPLFAKPNADNSKGSTTKFKQPSHSTQKRTSFVLTNAYPDPSLASNSSGTSEASNGIVLHRADVTSNRDIRLFPVRQRTATSSSSSSTSLPPFRTIPSVSRARMPRATANELVNMNSRPISELHCSRNRYDDLIYRRFLLTGNSGCGTSSAVQQQMNSSSSNIFQKSTENKPVALLGDSRKRSHSPLAVDEGSRIEVSSRSQDTNGDGRSFNSIKTLTMTRVVPQAVSYKIPGGSSVSKEQQFRRRIFDTIADTKVAAFVSRTCKVGIIFNRNEIQSLPDYYARPFPILFQSVVQDLINLGRDPYAVFCRIGGTDAGANTLTVAAPHRGGFVSKRLPIAQNQSSVWSDLRLLLIELGCCPNLISKTKAPCTLCGGGASNEQPTTDGEESVARIADGISVIVGDQYGQIIKEMHDSITIADLDDEDRLQSLLGVGQEIAGKIVRAVRLLLDRGSSLPSLTNPDSTLELAGASLPVEVEL